MSSKLRLRFDGQDLQQLGWHQAQWPALGSQVSIQVYATSRDAQAMVQDSVAWLERFEKLVSRFVPESQVSLANQSNGTRQEADELVLETVQASLWAAEKTGGLVDPLLGEHMENAGYQQSRAGKQADAEWAEVWLQPRHLAKANPGSPWREITTGQGWVQLPQGFSYDPGAVGKGLAADLLAQQLVKHSRAVLVDMGGDIRVEAQPDLPGFEIALQDPRNGQDWTNIEMHSGAVATSALCKRLWLRDGKPCHHLLSPLDGQPVWSGLAAATAFAATALEAETLAKWSLLIGSPEPLGYGGVLYPDDPRLMPQGVGSKQ